MLDGAQAEFTPHMRKPEKIHFIGGKTAIQRRMQNLMKMTGKKDRKLSLGWHS